MVDCSKCKNLVKHDIDDIECWCTKGMYEKFPYKPIFECEYFEARSSLDIDKCQVCKCRVHLPNEVICKECKEEMGK